MSATVANITAASSTTGQTVGFPAEYVPDCVINNTATVGIQYSTNGGSSWTTIAAGASATVDIDPATFRVRKATADSYPVPVSFDWPYDMQATMYLDSGVLRGKVAGQAAAAAGGGTDLGDLLQVGTTTARATNRAIIQDALNAGSLRITKPGQYHIGGYAPASWADFPALFSVPSDTEIYIGPGVELIAPPSIAGDVNQNCCVFANENILSNRVSVNVANTTFVAGTSTQRFARYTFETASPHGLSVGGYVLLKNDTSDYQWDGVYRVYAVPDSTHFTVEVFYRQANERPIASTLPTGPMICYKADNNINITIDGVLKMHNNVNDSFAGSLGRCGIALNKFGYAKVSANYDGVVVGLAACNYDMLEVPHSKFINGSIPIWQSGPFRDLVVGTSYVRGSEEIYIYNQEPGVFIFRDADNQGCNGGNIRSVSIKKLITSQNNIRGLLVQAGNNFSIGSVTVDEIHGYAQSALVEISVAAAQTGRIGSIKMGKIVHDPDPNSNTVFIQSTDTGNLTIDHLEFSVETPLRPYVNGKALGIRNNTTGICNLKQLIVNGSTTTTDATNSTATQAVIDVGPGVGWTVGEVDIDGCDFNAIGSTRSVNGVTISSSLAACGTVRVTNCTHNAALGALVSNGKAARLKVDRSHNKQNTTLGLVYSTESGAIEFSNCHTNAGTALAFLQGSNKTWNIKASCCDASDFGIKGYTGQTGNTINIWSGGGNSSNGGRIVPDNRSGTTISFKGNCADWSFPVDSAQCARSDGAIFYNSNAAAGTLGAAGLVVGQGTAAGSWRLMADPTKVY